MKKLIALSLAAISSLVISGNAIALPATIGSSIQIKADGARSHKATCFLLANIDGVTGSCDYWCEEEGQLAQSPTLTVLFREQKSLGAVNCNSNRMRIVPTLLQTLPDSMLFDQFEQPVKVNMCAGIEGSVLTCLLDNNNIFVPVSVTGG